MRVSLLIMSFGSVNEMVRRLIYLEEQVHRGGSFLQGGSSLCRYTPLASTWVRQPFIW